MEWHRLFVPEARAIVQKHLAVPARWSRGPVLPNTATLRFDAGEVAGIAHIRRPEAMTNENYLEEFTIRCGDHGRRTELEELLDGEIDVIFYGVPAPDLSEWLGYTVLDGQKIGGEWARTGPPSPKGGAAWFIPARLSDLPARSVLERVRNGRGYGVPGGFQYAMLDVETA